MAFQKKQGIGGNVKMEADQKEIELDTAEYEEVVKPCPFCGGPAVRKHFDGSYWTDCDKHCHGYAHYRNTQEAAEGWNKRA